MIAHHYERLCGVDSLTMSRSRYTDSLFRVVDLSVSCPIFSRLEEASCGTDLQSFIKKVA